MSGLVYDQFINRIPFSFLVQTRCGPQNCIKHPNVSEPIVSCGGRRPHCVATFVDAGCFKPPCLPWGQCQAHLATSLTDNNNNNIRSSDGKENDNNNKGQVSNTQVATPEHQPMTTNCVPNAARLGPNCARITLLFDKARLPSVNKLSSSFVCLLGSWKGPTDLFAQNDW